MHAYVYILCVHVCVHMYIYTYKSLNWNTCPELQVLIRPSSLIGEKCIY